jgi:superfamily II DNA or RNA helicase
MSSLFARKLELHPMRWYQEPAVPMFRQALKDRHRKIVGQAPCGWGKTVLAAHLAESSMQKGNRVLIACPRISLVDQTYISFEEQGINDIGIMQADNRRTNPMAQLQIACFDTLYNRPDEALNFGFVMVDEVHLADERMWKLVNQWKTVLALTATPWKKGLGLHFSKLIVLSTIHDMLEYHEKDPSVGLVPIQGIGPSPEFLRAVESLKTGQDGDVDEKAAGTLMEENEVVASIVDTWLRTRQEGKHPGDRTFVFARRRITAIKYQEAFAAQGIKMGYIDAFTSDRSPIFKRFRSRETQGIVSVGCLSTGVDEDVRCIVDAAPRKNQADIVQALGRGMRPAAGKEYCWLNDHVGNANRYGWFADIFHDKLDDTPLHVKGSAYEKDEATPQEVKRKQCAACLSFLPRGAFKCPSCGNQIVVDDTVTLNGELVELRRAKAEKKAKRELAAKEKAARAEKKKQGEPQAFYSGLIDFAQHRNWKENWARYKFKEKYGQWPDGPGGMGLNKVPMTPRKAVKEFIAESGRKWREQKKAATQPEEEYKGEF